MERMIDFLLFETITDILRDLGARIRAGGLELKAT